MPKLGKPGAGDIVAACDAGTSGVRCGLFDVQGNLVAVAHRLWGYERDPGAANGLMFDPDSVWNLAALTIRDAIASGEVQPARIRAISVTSQRLGLVLVDERGNGVKGIPNIDRRAVEQASFLGSRWGQSLYRRSGRWPGPGHALSKLLWLKDHEPEVFSRTSRLLSLGDWLLLRLGGQIATEPTSACETCLYDLVKGGWNLDIAEAANIETSILPRILASASPIGEVGKTASARTGLPEGTLVVMGGGDTECGVLGLGARKVGEVAVVAGSSAPLECVVDSPIVDSQFRTLTNPYMMRGKWVVESNAMLTGSSYSWLVSTFGSSPDSPGQPTRYEDLEREISVTEPGADGALCYLGSSIMDSRRGNFSATAAILAPMPAVNSRALTRGHLARAALEAEAYAIRANISQLTQVTGYSFDALLAGGGSLKSEAFRSILPDVLGMPVLSTDDEATPRGCAMCAAVGAGLFATVEEASEAMSPRPTVLEPDAKRSKQYESPFRRWLDGFEQVRGFSLE